MFIVGDGQGVLVDAATGEGLDDAKPVVVRAGQRIGIGIGVEKRYGDCRTNQYLR